MLLSEFSIFYYLVLQTTALPAVTTRAPVLTTSIPRPNSLPSTTPQQLVTKTQSAAQDFYFNIVGCYADQTTPRRDLQIVGPVTSNMTLQYCVNYCGTAVRQRLFDVM